MGLGSSCLEKVVIPYTNSPSTNPDAKLITISEFCKKLLTNIVRSFATAAGDSGSKPEMRGKGR